LNVNFDLAAYAGGFVNLRQRGRYFIGACPICGGRDRFTIKRNKDDVWICRKCTTDGKYHDAIDFVMRYHNVDFKEALRRMGEPLPDRKPENTPRPPVQVTPSPDWQAEAWRQIDAASDALIADETSQAAQYLAGRGISKGAIYMNLLGCAEVYGRPAIVIPWLDSGNTVTAVKYRFIDELARTDTRKRYAMRKGSMPFLFGLKHILETDTILLFVEGELNAVSILQCQPRGVSVVSAGSEGNGNEALIRTLASRYRRVFVWTDEAEKGHGIRGRMNRKDAALIKSPVLEGRKWDANEMLQAGALVDFLARKLSVGCDA
jgi:hypothetical protein